MSFQSSSLNQSQHVQPFLDRFGGKIAPRIWYTLKNLPACPTPLSVYYEHIWPRLNQAERVLDAGCGRGHHTRGLKAKVIGVDLDSAVVNHARQSRRGTAQYYVSDLRKIPSPDRYFDLVLAHNVIEHIPEDEAIISEMTRVLEPGGQLIVYTSNAANPFYAINRLLPQGLSNHLKRKVNQGQTNYKNRTPTFYKYNTVSRLDRALRPHSLHRQKLVRFMDFPITIDHAGYRFWWTNLNRLFTHRPFHFALPLFCAFYRKES